MKCLPPEEEMERFRNQQKESLEKKSIKAKDKARAKARATMKRTNA